MTKRIRNKMPISEENMEIKQFVKIMLLVVLIIVGVYFFTRAFVTKDLFDKDNTNETDESETASINYTTTTLGLLFNRPYKTYYVFAYDSKDAASLLYNSVRDKYTNEKDSVKLYYADLNNSINKTFTAEKSTPTAKTAKELKVKGLTLIKIENGKITKFLEEKDAIFKELEVK